MLRVLPSDALVYSYTPRSGLSKECNNVHRVTGSVFFRVLPDLPRSLGIRSKQTFHTVLCQQNGLLVLVDGLSILVTYTIVSATDVPPPK